MRIRSASERDVEALAAVMAASPLLRRYRVSARLARESLREALRERDVLLVALATDEVVGLAWVITTRAPDQAAYLLLARAEGRARRSGCRHLVLLVTKTNRRARAFYARHGYRHVGDLGGFVFPRIDEALYVKGVAARATARRRPA